jgi:hypothetical protein
MNVEPGPLERWRHNQLQQTTGGVGQSAVSDRLHHIEKAISDRPELRTVPRALTVFVNDDR